MKNAVIVLLVGLVLLLSARVIELENFRYATFVGFCADPPKDKINATRERYECLKEKETRTSPLWHLYYALVDGV